MSNNTLPALAGTNKDMVTAGEVNKELLLKFLNTLGLGNHLTEDMKVSFIEVALAYRLNPFKREIHASVYQKWNAAKGAKEPTMSIITGYEVYLKRAERIGTLEGWHVDTTGSVKEGNLQATITIHKRGWKIPFTHSVDYSEFVQTKSDGTPNAMWGGKPKMMLKKVAVSTGFRLAFPDELGGMPYTSDELPDAMTGASDVHVVPAKAAAPALKADFKRPEATGITDAEIVDKPAAAQPTTEELAAIAERKRAELKDKEAKEAAAKAPAKDANGWPVGNEAQPAAQPAASDAKTGADDTTITNVVKVRGSVVFRIFAGERIYMTADAVLAEEANSNKGQPVVINWEMRDTMLTATSIKAK